MISQKAILYMILSALCFTAVNASVRYVDHLPTFELLFFRAIGSVVLCWIILRHQKIEASGNNKKWLIIRALVGFTSISLFFKAMQMMPLASAVSLRYLSPFFATAIAIYFLNEKVKKLQWLFFATAFLGVLLLKGFDTRISLLALGVILGSAFFSGWVYVCIRKLGKTEHPIVIMNYFLSFTCIVSGIISLFYWVSPTGIEWIVLLNMGLFGFFAQYFMTVALQLEEANVVTPMKYTEVVFTVLAGWMIFGEYQSWIAILAMMLIIISLIANVIVKQGKVL
jgi:drug/metabolite transporter (DMT)-like permease